MNESINNLNQNNYDSLNNNEIQNNQSSNVNQNTNSQPTSINKKKLKWWIPLLLFIVGVLLAVSSYIAKDILLYILNSREEFVFEYQIRNHPAILIFRWLAAICWVLVIPSLIIVIVKYRSKKSDNQ